MSKKRERSEDEESSSSSGSEEEEKGGVVVFGSLSEADIAKLTGNERMHFIFSHEQELWLRARLNVYMSEFVDVESERDEKDQDNPHHAVEQFRIYHNTQKTDSKMISDWLMHKNPFIRAQAATIYSVLRREYKLMKHRIELLDPEGLTSVLHREQVETIYSVLRTGSGNGGNSNKKRKLVAMTRQPGVRKRRIPNGYICFCKEMNRTNSWSGTKGKVHTMWARLPQEMKNHFNKLALTLVEKNPQVYRKDAQTLFNNKSVRRHMSSISEQDIRSNPNLSMRGFHEFIHHRNRQSSNYSSSSEDNSEEEYENERGMKQEEETLDHMLDREIKIQEEGQYDIEEKIKVESESSSSSSDESD